jgi:hypothetical protein
MRYLGSRQHELNLLRNGCDFHAGFECEEHNNPADFFLDVIMQCEDVKGSGKLIAM